MPSTAPVHDPRFAPRARRELGEMFSGVSPRYDLLNALLSLGQDRTWRRALWRAVPEDARQVLDVCCGNGVSTIGLRRPWRILLGVDASPQMLEAAQERFGGCLGGPHFVCTDAFHLPLAGASVDAVTIAFGLRNLRPRLAGLRELARVLRPGGTLAILEAAAPRPGPWAGAHRFYLEVVVPLLGLLSPDPGAYRYLARSVLEFGDGRDLHLDLARAGLEPLGERPFLAGASWLWTARRLPGAGQSEAARPKSVQSATPSPGSREAYRSHQRQRDWEWRIWRGTLLALHLALVTVLVMAIAGFDKFIDASRLATPLQVGGKLLLWVGLVFFGVRTLVVAARLRYPPEDF